ncbi:MAG TPA: metallophosphoesterase, partial [Hanamia sp.]|nr:metallophosphoesterase [Hanamia sp.]
MRTPLGTFIVILIMILLDIYVFMTIKSVSHSASSKLRTVIYVIYWILAIVAIAGLLLFIFTGPEFLPKKVRTYLFASILAFVF